ncbi:MAG: DUF932 domain-containing protein [Oscillospiraceae bacterium]
MPANVESMFYVREAPWHGLGICVEEALDSKAALEKLGLDWKVIQKPIMTADNEPIPGFKANIRDTDSKVLGVVTDRYKVVQNSEAFSFTDTLLNEGVRYETAGSLQDGKKIWLLAKLPDKYVIEDEQIEPYLPMDDEPTDIHRRNITRIREDMKHRYFDAPDLRYVGKTGYRFINAVSDFATHAKPLRETSGYRENMFARTIEGNSLIDKAYEMVISAA